MCKCPLASEKENIHIQSVSLLLISGIIIHNENVKKSVWWKNSNSGKLKLFLEIEKQKKKISIQNKTYWPDILICQYYLWAKNFEKNKFQFQDQIYRYVAKKIDFPLP